MTQTSKSIIHRSKYGTFHPADNQDVAWTVNDTRGYIDGGPACDECGACECVGPCADGCINPAAHITDCDLHGPDGECVGLSFVYICLDGGDTLCEACFETQDDVEVVECDCK
jgi:hypothetical protein